jgi:very-short-patch-repair endonuclease
MGTLILFAVLFLASVVFFVGHLNLQGNDDVGSGHRYQAQTILTDNELEFFHRIRRSVPDLYVFPQVAMSALMRAVGADNKTRRAASNAIAQKRVDFAIYSKEMTLLCIVELDDKTHSAEKDAKRDDMLKSAGIQTVRWDSRRKPDEEQIRSTLGKYLTHTSTDSSNASRT